VTGLAPFDEAVAGLDPTAEHVEPTARRIRVRLGSRLVADTGRALLMIRYGPKGLPTYFLPREDVAPDALVDESRDDDALVDESRDDDGQSTWTVCAGPDRALGAAWTDSHPTLAGHVTFSWRRCDWYEEDERVRVHARSPYGRVDTLRSSRLVEIRVAGVTVARSIRPLLLFETHLPARYYLPYADVHAEFLEASDTVTECPYKGVARYWSVRAGGVLVPDAAWSYPEPIPENPEIRDLVCFFTERVDLVLDGVRQPRTVSPWSDGTAAVIDSAADR
jgi:uncharacterized protein (DUF427 family)